VRFAFLQFGDIDFTEFLAVFFGALDQLLVDRYPDVCSAVGGVELEEATLVVCAEIGRGFLWDSADYGWCGGLFDVAFVFGELFSFCFSKCYRFVNFIVVLISLNNNFILIFLPFISIKL
jgi:hypothetical protein